MAIANYQFLSVVETPRRGVFTESELYAIVFIETIQKINLHGLGGFQIHNGYLWCFIPCSLQADR